MNNASKPAAVRLAYSYTRFSDPIQAKGDSARRQFSPVEKLCQEKGWTLAPATYKDPGFSAYTGKHLEKGVLGVFVAAAKAGRVPEGSVLIIEHIDRVSRMKVGDGLQLFLDLIRSGVCLYVMMDNHLYTREEVDNDLAPLMMVVGRLWQAHEESKKKGERVHAAWEQKQLRAAEEPMSKYCPSWLQVVDNRYVWNEKNKAIMLRIVRDFLAGQSCQEIARQLNREEVPTFRKGGAWIWSTVNNMLKSQRLIGYWQPHDRRMGKQIPKGQPVKIYPPLISEAEFYQIQHARERRATVRKGRNGQKVNNLFGALIVNGDDGSKMRLHIYSAKARESNRKGSRSHFLKSDAHGQGLAKDRAFFSYDVFETAFLHWLREVDPAQILGTGKAQPKSELENVQNELAQKVAVLDKAKRKLEAEGDSAAQDTLLEIIASTGKRVAELRREEEKLKLATAGAQIAFDPHDFERMMEMMEKAEGEERVLIRSRLQSAIALAVHSITFYVRELWLPKDAHPGIDKLRELKPQPRGKGMRWRVGFAVIGLPRGAERVLVMMYKSHAQHYPEVVHGAKNWTHDQLQRAIAALAERRAHRKATTDLRPQAQSL